MHSVELRAGSGAPVVVHPGQPATIGRSDAATLRVANLLVSATHLQISWSNGVAVATDISSTNGTYDAQGRRMTSVVVDRPVTVMLGDPRVGEPIGLAPLGQAATPPPPPGHRSGNLIIGRGDDVDIVVPDDLASRRHASLTLHPVPTIVDLGSLNGTQLNGQSVAQAELHDGDILTIGNTDLVYRAGQLAVRDETSSGNQQLVVRGVDFAVDNGARLLLRGVDFTARTGTLTALIGPSGAGKSTLGRLLTGLTSPSAGEVFFAGHDLHADYASLRSRIGFVPQDDVVHTKLTVRQALRYSAELRLPPDTSNAKRDEICQRVMAELGLTERADLRIDKLSGGQRKRVSVAMELITSPSLLVLDEPTSGLDPALDRQVMELLQQLARGGRVVIVVTHSLAYLHLTDQVLLLAPGGLPSYFGPPAGIDQAYGTSDWANVFESVTQDPQAAWTSYLLRTGRTRHEVERLIHEPPRPSAGRRTARPSHRRRSPSSGGPRCARPPR